MGESDNRLFADEPSQQAANHQDTAASVDAARTKGEHVVRVIVDVPAITEPLDYVVSPTLAFDPTERTAPSLSIGTMLRVPLGSQTVDAWIVDVDPQTDIDRSVTLRNVTLRNVTSVAGFGPLRDVIELSAWVGKRWVGRRVVGLRAASPPRRAKRIPAPVRATTTEPTAAERAESSDTFLMRSVGIAPEILREPVSTVLQLPPNAHVADLVADAERYGPVLVICPTAVVAKTISEELSRRGQFISHYPQQWEHGRAGASVIGMRTACFASVPNLATIIVVDEHSEFHQNEGSPTFHARDIAIERGKQLNIPIWLTSPMPSLTSRQRTTVVSGSRSYERNGWSTVDVVDRRNSDMAREGLFSPRVVQQLREADSTIVVLNRKGRAKALWCNNCRSRLVCERCQAGVVENDNHELECQRCDLLRPVVCTHCGGTSAGSFRLGVSRVAQDCQALTNRTVEQYANAAAAAELLERGGIVVSTEASLYQRLRAERVVFLDFDAEMMSPKYRAAERSLGLLVEASRIVSAHNGGTVTIQTTHPDHEVVRSAVQSDPNIVALADTARREMLELPPFGSIAVVGSTGAPEFMVRLGAPAGLRVDQQSPTDWIIRAPDTATPIDALNRVERPPERLRLQIDPMSIPKLTTRP